MFEKIEFILLLIIILLVTIFLGYWAVTSLQSGSEYKLNDQIKQLKNENESLKKDIVNMTAELDALRPLAEQPTLSEPTPIVEEPVTSKTYKNQSLIDELQKLVADNIYMKLGSSGARVGTVQRFLNIYNSKINKIDNDYGASTKTAVALFQKAVGITADGEAGVGTFNKMIDWLKKQN
jgi:hypothetical protein